MSVKRAATIVVTGGALAAWLAGAATSSRPAAPVHVLPTAPIDSRGAQLANEIGRLHVRLHPSAAVHQPGRNLFAFRAAPARTAPPVVAAPAPAIAESPPMPPLAPPLKLAGIAENAGPDGPTRIAFINGDGQLFMVKEGDTVMLRYRVTRISADVVELADVADGTVRRLALR